MRTVGTAFLGIALAAGAAFGGVRAFGGVHRPAPAQGVCSRDWSGSSLPRVGDSTFLSDVAAVSPDDMWVVGSAIGHPTHPVIEHWNGESWSTMPSPGVPGAGLVGVTALSATDVWAVGDRTTEFARSLVEHWDGVRWSVVPSPNFVDSEWRHNVLVAVTGTAPNDVWAAGWTTNEGGRHARALIEHWDGSSWSIVAPPQIDSPSVLLNDVNVVGPDDVWAVGQRAVGSARLGFSTFPLVMHWDGASWTVVPTPDADGHSAWLSGVAGTSQADVWAVGSGFDQTKDRVIPIVMHWNGSAWGLVKDLPSSLPYGLDAVDAVGPDDVWAADKGVSYAYALHWNGRSWSLVAPPGGPIKGGRLGGIVAFPSGEAVAVGSTSVETGMSPLAVRLCRPTRSTPSG